MKYILIDVLCVLGMMGSCDAAFVGADENNYLLRIAGVVGFSYFAWRYKQNAIEEYETNPSQSRSDEQHDSP